MSTATLRTPKPTKQRTNKRVKTGRNKNEPKEPSKGGGTRACNNCNRSGIRVAKKKKTKTAKRGYWSGLFAGTRDI